MRLRGWPAASLVMLLALGGAAALFWYVDQTKQESIRTLKQRLADIERQNVQEDKGRQAASLATEAAERMNAYIRALEARAEAVAGEPAFRRNGRGPKSDALKVAAFRQGPGRAKSEWSAGVLTDERGRVLASFGLETTPDSLSATTEFKEASRLRATVLRAREMPSDRIAIQLTVPSFGDRGDFVGAIQLTHAVPPDQIAAWRPQSGLLVMVGDSQGRRWTPGPQPSFPKNLSPLSGEDAVAMQRQNDQAGATFFRLRWEGADYLAGSAASDLPGMRVYTLLGVGGMDKLFGAQGEWAPLWNDPIVLGGLAGITLLGLLLMAAASGQSLDPLKRLNRQLGSRLSEHGQLSDVSRPANGEWAKLADLINILVDRAKSGAIPVSIPAGEPKELARLRGEVDNLREAQQRRVAELSAAQERVGALEQEKQELEAVLADLRAHQRDADLDKSLHEASAVRIEAITSMSEDLKSTLLVIKNYISSILASEEGKITDTQQEFLGVVINKSARLERQINDLLDISHLEGEAEAMYLMPTDLVPMLHDVVLNTQPQADTKQVTLTQEIQSSLPSVNANSDRLGQMFVNLVQHALKITPVGGEVQISATEGIDAVIVKLRDGGPPLTMDMVQRVFTTFHGPESPSGPALSGTGLRFPIMKLIVDAHHGSITVRGLPEQGNEVVVTLPTQATGEPGRNAAMAAIPSAYTGEVAPPPPPAETSPEEENYFDLTSLITAPEGSAAPMSGGEELDELLKDIENIDERMEP